VGGVSHIEGLLKFTKFLVSEKVSYSVGTLSISHKG